MNVQSLLFFDHRDPLFNVNNDLCSEFNRIQHETCGVDIEILRKELFPRTCTGFMQQVIFLGRKIPCEKLFEPHHTEVGDCFTANSFFFIRVPKQLTRCNFTRFECVKDSRLDASRKTNRNPCALPSCLAMEIVEVGHFAHNIDEPVKILIIDILNKPILRYIRQVGTTKLDLIGECLLV